MKKEKEQKCASRGCTERAHSRWGRLCNKCGNRAYYERHNKKINLARREKRAKITGFYNVALKESRRELFYNACGGQLKATQVLDQIDPIESLILRSYYLDGANNKQIAKGLNVTSQAIGSRRKRIEARLGLEIPV